MRPPTDMPREAMSFDSPRSRDPSPTGVVLTPPGPSPTLGTSSLEIASIRESLQAPIAITAAVILAVIAAATLLLWRPVAVPPEWLTGAIIGAGLLIVTLFFDFVLVVRNRRPLEVALLALRAATNDLARLNASLFESNRALAETADERTRALAELQASIRERERFLEAVAHDLRTPLTVIKGHSQLLRRTMCTSDPREPVAEASASQIDQTTDQMANLIDELLEWVRTESGNVPRLHRVPIDLVAIARKALSRYVELFTGHPIQLETAVPSIIGNWDARLLERLLDNLLSNAIKYSPMGGEIRLGVTRDENEANLSVGDSGIGIPAADIPRVFEPYYRGANVADQLPGVGLGLAATRGIVEAHNGTIDIMSREGHGTTVTVRLPIQSDPTSLHLASHWQADVGPP
jgi:signal transduction histidine kinase